MSHVVPDVPPEVKAVEAVYAATFEANNTSRNHAEEQLKQFECQAGFVTLVFQVVMNVGAADAVRQAAAIHAKNIIRSRWNKSPHSEDDRPTLDESERHVLKANLFEAVVFAANTPGVQRCLLECMKLIIRHDFPEGWPGLLPQVQQGILSQDAPRIKTSLMVLHALCQKYQYMHYDNRQTQYEIAASMLPGLLEVFKHCMTNDSDESAHMCRYTAKLRQELQQTRQNSGQCLDQMLRRVWHCAPGNPKGT